MTETKSAAATSEETELDPGGKKTKARKGKILIFSFLALALGGLTTLLARMGLYSSAIWVFFGGAFAALVALNLQLKNHAWKHRKANRTTAYLTLGVLAVCVAAQIWAPKKAGSQPPQNPGISQASTASNGISLTAATTGNNSPIVQAGVVNINNGISAEKMLELLQDKFAADKLLAQKYPFGYALFGLAQGRIVYVPKFFESSIAVDWDGAKVTIDQANRVASVYLSRIIADGSVFSHNYASVRYQNNESVPVPPVLGAKTCYLSVLDSTNSVFVLGFAPPPPKLRR